MQGMTHLELSGILTADAELRYTPSGLAILTFTLAGATPVPSGDDTPDRHVSWYHRCTMFGAFAEAMADDLKAGTAAYTTARLRYRTWETQQGEKRSGVDIHVDTFKVLDPPPPNRLRHDRSGQTLLLGAVNRALAMGNLTRAPELRYTQAGNPVTNTALAVNEKVKDQEITGFYDLTAWGSTAERLAEGAQKGAPLIATGRLQGTSWTDRAGNKRYGTTITLDAFELVARPNDDATTARPAAGAAPAAPGERQRPTAPTGPASIEDEFPPEEDLPF